MKSDRTGSHIILGAKTGKPPFLFSRCRKGLWTAVRLTILLQNKKINTLQKTQRNVKLLQTFLGTKNELRKVEEIPALELNEYMCEFIISVRTKDGKDYEPSSLRSFERHLKKNSYSASIMNDLEFEKTRKVLLSKQKEFTKKGKGNKPNADGEEYLEFNESQTKTRTGSDCRDAAPTRSVATMEETEAFGGR